MRIACFSAGFRRFKAGSWLGCGLLGMALLATGVWAETDEPSLPKAAATDEEEAFEPEAKEQEATEPGALEADNDAEEAPLPAKVKTPVRMVKQPVAKKDPKEKEDKSREICPRTRPVEKPISDIPLDASPPDDGLKNKDGSPFLPPDCAKELILHEGEQVAHINLPRPWGEGTFCWKASGLCHRPLYTEDVVLERYGQKSIVPGLQPVISGVRFYGSLALLPYKFGVEGWPRECVYTLGYYRPGRCPPHFFQRPPLDLDGALYEVGAISGLILLLP